MWSQPDDNTLVSYLNNNIESLMIDVGSSTDTSRAVSIVKEVDGSSTVTEWLVLLDGNLNAATADAILLRLPTVKGPLSEMRFELDNLRAMIRRYKSIPALQPTDRARVGGLDRLVNSSDQALLRAADMSLVQVLGDPAARLQKQEHVREGSSLAALAAKSLEEEGHRMNRDDLGLDTPTFDADKQTLAKLAFKMEYWTKAFDDKLFN